MRYPPGILVLDHLSESRVLLVASLRRTFSQSVLFACESFTEGAEVLACLGIDVLVVHQDVEHDCADLVRRFRRLDAKMPLIAVCPPEQREAVLTAGATGFIQPDECLLLGNAVEQAWHQKQWLDARRGLKSHPPLHPSPDRFDPWEMFTGAGSDRCASSPATPLR